MNAMCVCILYRWESATNDFAISFDDNRRRSLYRVILNGRVVLLVDTDTYSALLYMGTVGMIVKPDSVGYYTQATYRYVACVIYDVHNGSAVAR